ncbi:YqcI/YcgG family protein [Thioalkalivibrio sp. AKL10]|uniref:YqcI/YcgG family protein n=1 Tax=Thioalkalivibrio sp. AKL10 TaxID=1158158 RepID=UPI001E301440|nr:YqcI/YcgG family protein [Thioalkalivibrio sp. AKL10]
MKHPGDPGTNEVGLQPVPDLGGRFLALLAEATYPCVGAKSALARGSIETHEFGALGDPGNDRAILDGLSRFVAMIEASACNEDIVHSYVALFSGPGDMSELRFESLMWAQLWRIHKLDILAGNPPADDVNSDSDSPLFSRVLPRFGGRFGKG